uniref:Uncharacterized protein n=1 Tax=Anguilla anguilla TaxID=7936 RepID=A0A0E9U1U8_ANGAN
MLIFKSHTHFFITINNYELYNNLRVLLLL